MAFLQMQSIHKRFGATVAVAGVDLEVRLGEVLGLVGENGSGKSTLMRILAGALALDSGQMILDGRLYSPVDPAESRRAGVSMIYQELALCPHLSVAENIVLGAEVSFAGVMQGRLARTKAREALSKLGYGDLDVDQPVRKLPIALRQIVEIARAVALGSKLIVLDEPTSSLSLPDAERLFQVVKTLKEEGHAIVYISHFLEEITRVTDRIVVLRDGRVVGTARTEALTPEEIVSMMVGRHIESAFPHSRRTPGERVLTIANLKGHQKPTSASFILRKGEVFGLAGLNGSGRTELLKVIFGLDEVRSGEIRVAAFTGPASPGERWSQGVGLLSEDRKEEGLALSMSIADNLTLTRLATLGPAGAISSRRQTSATQEWIEKLGIRCSNPQQPVGELSGGNQQKVALARLLYHDVDVLLLDEPTRGIDIGSKEQIYRLIDQAALVGKAVLVVSSYLPELLGICDRIAVMHKGELLPARPVQELSEDVIMREAAGAW